MHDVTTELSTLAANAVPMLCDVGRRAKLDPPCEFWRNYLFCIVKLLGRLHCGGEVLICHAHGAAAFAEAIFDVLANIVDVCFPDALLFVGRERFERTHNAHANACRGFLGVPPRTEWN